MALTTCFSCGQKVSTRAAACPNPACGLPHPGDRALHQAIVRQATGASGAPPPAPDEATPEARVFAMVDALIAEIDGRTAGDVSGAEVKCAECGTKARMGDAVGRPCGTCGYPDVVPCAMPPHCDRSALRMRRVSGRWLPICGRHSGCTRCGELIDETRHDARVEIDPRRLSRPGRGLTSRVPSGLQVRLRTHLDPVVCDAMTWLRQLSRLGLTLAPSAGEGVEIATVLRGSPARAGKLKLGDRLVALDGRRISGAEHLVSLLADAPAGAPIRFEVLRKSKGFEVDLTPGPVAPF